jgi:uncharacterized protein involved in exopolysaccharide biosynthesis
MGGEEQALQAARQTAEGDLLDYWRIVWTRWWLIGALVVISAVTAYIISNQQPKMYTSTVTVMATVGGSGGGGSVLGLGDLVRQGGTGSVLGWMSGPLGGAKDRTMAVLKTVTLAKEIVEKFNLMEAYRTASEIKAAGALLGRTEVFANKEGAIVIAVEDTDPKRAADIANYYPEALDRVLARFSVSNVSRQRAFIEQRREETQKALRQAEEDLRAFQEKNRMILPPEKQQDAIKTSIEGRGTIGQMEVELEGMRRYATDQNPDVVVLEARIRETKRKLAQSQYGGGIELPADSVNPGQSRKDIFIPAARMPELVLDFQRLAREVKIQETVYQVLTSQLETAKIEEARNLPTIEVLDRAIPSDFAVKPRTRQNVVFAAAAGVFLGVFLAFFLEYLSMVRMRRQARNA